MANSKRIGLFVKEIEKLNTKICMFESMKSRIDDAIRFSNEFVTEIIFDNENEGLSCDALIQISKHYGNRIDFYKSEREKYEGWLRLSFSDYSES